MNERRISRLEALIQEKVATTLQRDMSDPRLGLVTVTRVKLDRELTQCKIYWTVLGDEKQRRVHERTLKHAAGFVRREIAGILHTRSVPVVLFVFDESVGGALRIEGILKRLKQEREARGDMGDESLVEGDDPADSALDDAADSDDFDDDLEGDDDLKDDDDLDADVDVDAADDGTTPPDDPQSRA